VRRWQLSVEEEMVVFGKGEAVKGSIRKTNTLCKRGTIYALVTWKESECASLVDNMYYGYSDVLRYESLRAEILQQRAAYHGIGIGIGAGTVQALFT
jgi:hypothetical protein